MWAFLGEGILMTRPLSLAVRCLLSFPRELQSLKAWYAVYQSGRRRDVENHKRNFCPQFQGYQGLGHYGVCLLLSTISGLPGAWASRALRSLFEGEGLGGVAAEDLRLELRNTELLITGTRFNRAAYGEDPRHMPQNCFF